MKHLVFGFFALVTAAAPGVASAADSLGSATIPAYSAKQILTYSPSSPNGNYVFEVDGAGGLSPFAAFADMTTAGGGWTMVHDRTGTAPDMDSFWQSALSIYGPMQLRIQWMGQPLDAYFDFNYSPTSSFNTPFANFADSQTAWTYIAGNYQKSTLVVAHPYLIIPVRWLTLNQIMTDTYMQSQFSVYVREVNTPAYIAPTAPVPEPETYAMFLAGLGLMGAIARRKKLAA